MNSLTDNVIYITYPKITMIKKLLLILLIVTIVFISGCYKNNTNCYYDKEKGRCCDLSTNTCNSGFIECQQSYHPKGIGCNDECIMEYTCEADR